jgi:1,4-dihydroxy-2-naphthoyl-CoA hydrolase
MGLGQSTRPHFSGKASMRIWKKPISVDILTESHRRTAPELLGMEFVEVGDDFIVARIPVDERTRQPYGLLHGGVSVVLAETLGSCGAYYSCPPEDRAVGARHHPRGAHWAQHPGVAHRHAQRGR